MRSQVVGLVAAVKVFLPTAAPGVGRSLSGGDQRVGVHRRQAQRADGLTNEAHHRRLCQTLIADHDSFSCETCASNNIGVTLCPYQSFEDFVAVNFGIQHQDHREAIPILAPNNRHFIAVTHWTPFGFKSGRGWPLFSSKYILHQFWFLSIEKAGLRTFLAHLWPAQDPTRVGRLSSAAPPMCTCYSVCPINDHRPRASSPSAWVFVTKFAYGICPLHSSRLPKGAHDGVHNFFRHLHALLAITQNDDQCGLPFLAVDTKSVNPSNGRLPRRAVLLKGVLDCDAERTRLLVTRLALTCVPAPNFATTPCGMISHLVPFLSMWTVLYIRLKVYGSKRFE